MDIRAEIEGLYDSWRRLHDGEVPNVLYLGRREHFTLVDESEIWHFSHDEKGRVSYSGMDVVRVSEDEYLHVCHAGADIRVVSRYEI